MDYGGGDHLTEDRGHLAIGQSAGPGLAYGL